MRFDVITLFPEAVRAAPERRASRGAPSSRARSTCKLWQLRDFADNAYRRVDDRPYGGGPGMVMLAEPLERALAAVRAARAERTPRRWCTSRPTGRRLDQALVQRVCRGPGAVLLCGRYEGIDQRFIDPMSTSNSAWATSCCRAARLPALALLDAVARLQPGVLGDARSHQQDSFSDGLLDCPHYSRPEVLAASGAGAVPAVLLSGHHARHRALAARAVAGADRSAAAPTCIAAARARRAAERRPTRPILACSQKL